MFELCRAARRKTKLNLSCSLTSQAERTKPRLSESNVSLLTDCTASVVASPKAKPRLNERNVSLLADCTASEVASTNFSTQYSVLSTQYSVLSTQYSVLSTLFSVLCSLLASPKFTLGSPAFYLFPFQYDICYYRCLVCVWQEGKRRQWLGDVKVCYFAASY